MPTVNNGIESFFAKKSVLTVSWGILPRLTIPREKIVAKLTKTENNFNSFQTFGNVSTHPYI